MKKSQYIFGALALIAFPNWAQAQTQAKDTTLSRTVKNIIRTSWMLPR